MVSTATKDPSAERTNFVGCHREGVNVRLLLDVALSQTETKVINSLRGLITNYVLSAGCRSIFSGNVRIGDDPRDSKISNACEAVISDQNVPLAAKQPLVQTDIRGTVSTHRVHIPVNNA
jgi:hypothetical protein